MAVLYDFARNGLGVPLVVMIVIAMMVLPLPAFLLDVFFTFNISLSLTILLAVIYVRRALEFATFPTVLLGATLLRLGLNVASTRIVLMKGQRGCACSGSRDCGIRPVCGRWQLRGRHGGVHGIGDHQLRGDHQRRWPHL